jgi:flagellar hook assembly protein FlgD
MEEGIFIPDAFVLEKNFPNPFNPTTVIGYQLSAVSNVELSIYNILGEKVTTLVSEKQNAGHHQVEWNASGFASGVYYYRIEAGEFVDVKKMVLLR